MSTDAAAREYLDYYLDRPGDPDFAVMLEGPWGSGKSFFFDRYFKDRLAEARKINSEASEEIRVTLFGVRDLNDITSQIFAKLHPYLTGKTAQVVNVIGSKLISHFGLAAKPEENASLLQKMLLNLQDRVLVFDDFERCPLPVVEVMGFINRFVEQDKLKVIVVASEEDIDPAQKKEYERRKEKLIGKTIRVGSDAGIVLDAFTSVLVSTEAKAAITANRDDALATFNAGEKPNFRSLRSILADYDRLVGLADPKLRASPDALAALLLYMLAIGMEYRGGRIDAGGLRTLTRDIGLRLNFNNDTESAERQRGRLLRTTYDLVSWRDPIVPPELLAELFASGTIDLAALNEQLLNHPKVVGAADAPEWRAMWSWYDMGESEYRPVRNAYASQLQSRALVEPGQILHAAGTSIRLLVNGDDLLGGKKPRAFFVDYLADLEAADTLLARPDLFGMGSGAYGGIVYNENESKAFIEIHDLVRAATMRALARRAKRESVDLLKRLQANPNVVGMLHEWGFEKQNYAGIAILHYIAVTDMADLLMIDSRLNDRLLAALVARYDLARDSSLDPEKKWVQQLHTELKKRLTLTPAPFKKWNKGRITYYFNKLEAWAKPHKQPTE